LSTKCSKQEIEEKINEYKMAELIIFFKNLKKMYAGTLIEINVDKFFLNFENDKKIYGDHILQTFKKKRARKEGNQVDLIFIQGQQSHPLETWSLSPKNRKELWPVKILSPALNKKLENKEIKNNAIYMLRHDSYQLKRTHDYMNVPNNGI